LCAGGPGLGNIAPEQSDYFAVVKGGGHGNYKNFVVAPASVQEMADLTILAFELADRYRNPAVVLTDGFIGQMMEPLELHERVIEQPQKPWAIRGTSETRKNLISSIYLEPDELEIHVRKLDDKYKKAAELEPRNELYRAEDPELLLVGYGIASRVLRSVVGTARREGVRAGLFRPITLWPFPSGALRKAARRAQMVMVVEMSTGQMVEDVRLALDGRVAVEFYSRTGGNVPLADEVGRELFARMGLVTEWGL
jgi:pyruvate/2-oxoacid:ferredoxin oxidoreductase alpha subunit